jgi:hypothetical protein
MGMPQGRAPVGADQAMTPQDQPVHVFAHVLVPHDPLSSHRMDAVCRLRRRRARQTLGYVEQVAYANRLIEEIVTAFRPSAGVILIQADEGPYPDRDYSVPWQSHRRRTQIKTGILNAFYFPAATIVPSPGPYASETATEFCSNKYFHTEFPKLPDRIYAFQATRNYMSL